VVPLSHDLEQSASTIWDHQNDGAMQSDEGYYETRDHFAYQAWISLGNKPFNGVKPVGELFFKKIELYKETTSKRKTFES